MATLKHWTSAEDAALAAAFGGQAALDMHIARRVHAYLDYLVKGRVVVMTPPNHTLRSAVKATGKSRGQVLNRLEQLSRIALSMNVAESMRGPRRDVLRQYAIAGLRTLDEIRAADEGGQLTVPGIDAPKAAASAPKPRTLDDIANELREARKDAARLSVAAIEASRAAAHAEKRMNELRDELMRAVEEV